MGAQGENSYPVLFAIYLNDFNESMKGIFKDYRNWMTILKRNLKRLCDYVFYNTQMIPSYMLKLWMNFRVLLMAYLNTVKMVP